MSEPDPTMAIVSTSDPTRPMLEALEDANRKLQAESAKLRRENKRLRDTMMEQSREIEELREKYNQCTGRIGR